MYVITHIYDVDGGYGDNIETLQIIGIAQTEEEAKEYCDAWSNSHIYHNPYAQFYCGELIYEEVPLIKDLNKPPHEYNENAVWAFDKESEDYCDLETEWERIKDAIRKYRLQGMTARVIAGKLGISESSVRTCIKEGK